MEDPMGGEIYASSLDFLKKEALSREIMFAPLPAGENEEVLSLKQILKEHYIPVEDLNLSDLNVQKNLFIYLLSNICPAQSKEIFTLAILLINIFLWEKEIDPSEENTIDGDIIGDLIVEFLLPRLRRCILNKCKKTQSGIFNLFGE